MLYWLAWPSQLSFFGNLYYNWLSMQKKYTYTIGIGMTVISYEVQVIYLPSIICYVYCTKYQNCKYIFSLNTGMKQWIDSLKVRWNSLPFTSFISKTIWTDNANILSCIKSVINLFFVWWLLAILPVTLTIDKPLC